MSKGLRQSGVPLGGLGTGSVEMRRDGLFHEWQIMNNDPWGAGQAIDAPENTLFFGLQLHGAGQNRSAVLSLPPKVNPWSHHPYDIPWLEHPSSIESKPRFPFTDLSYQLDNLPVSVELEAFTPFIPLDAKNSGLPLAFLTFTLESNAEEEIKTTLFGCMANLVGYTSQDCQSRMDVAIGDGLDHLLYSREDLDLSQSDAGTMALGILGDRGTSTYCTFPRPRDIWDPMRETGKLENVDVGKLEEEVGNVGDSRRINRRKGLPHSALARTIELLPGETVKLTFVLTWHFPNLIEADYGLKQVCGSNIGHMYTNWFKDATEVLTYAADNYSRLRNETLNFVERYYDSSQPEWLLDAIAAQLTTLTKASWWDKEGRFGIWEGLGCCGLQTVDITHYGSFPIVQFFPEIQKSQMRLSRDNAEEKGKIPHLMPGNFSCCDLDERERIDLIPEFILIVWRDLLWTGDLNYLREMWTPIKDSLKFIAQADTDGDGLPNNSGPDQTYDQFPLKGTSSFVGFLYLASLQALAEMAVLMDEPDLEKEMNLRYTAAAEKLQEQLWNGTYFRLSHDPFTKKNNEGIMVDQINADWFMRQCIGEGLIDDEMARSSVKSIFKACSHPTGYLGNCVWPDGSSVEIGRHTSDQAKCPWSGVEYAFAAHLVLLGLTDEAMQVTRNVWDRYERAGLRYNHIECGSHYYRAMSSWAIYLALAGYIIDVLHETITLKFKTNRRTVLNSPYCWGTLTVDNGTAEIKIERGKLNFKQIKIQEARFTTARILLNGGTIENRVNKGRIDLDDVLKLARGDELSVTLS